MKDNRKDTKQTELLPNGNLLKDLRNGGAS